jgi:hypothetical protein
MADADKKSQLTSVLGWVGFCCGVVIAIIWLLHLPSPARVDWPLQWGPR